MWKSIRKYIIMPEENINQEFSLKKVDEIKKLCNWRNKSKWMNE